MRPFVGRPRLLPLVVLFPALAILTASAPAQSLDQFSNSLAPTVGSPEKAIDRMLQMANLKSGETLYDLGCGDGRILIAAAKQYKVKAVGVEISDRLAKRAAEKVKKAGLEKQITVIHGNFMHTDLSHADVVTLYLATSANASLRPALERALKPNARVVSYDYPIPGWRSISTADTTGYTGEHVIYLYEVPESITRK